MSWERICEHRSVHRSAPWTLAADLDLPGADLLPAKNGHNGLSRAESGVRGTAEPRGERLAVTAIAQM